LLRGLGQWQPLVVDHVIQWSPNYGLKYPNINIRMIMEADCNLVMYNNRNQPKWATGTYKQGNHVCCLHLTDECILRLHQDNYEMWNSTKSKGNK
uniref:Bulb-type lectin domain-containing protein n=1 Tax=Poecilia reticulata TaxID=8081 RepID=A0A3P9NGE4_POERE